MAHRSENGSFLPTTLAEAKRQGIRELDVIIVSADAYVDHPSFACSIIGRYLESLGLKVGIIPQPDWHSADDFRALGRPRLFFGVTAGNMDSMLLMYTAQRKIRSDDPYSPGGEAGRRPYLPTVVYTNRIKEAFRGVPVIIGGIEASLRRLAHYDFYTDRVRPSVLMDSKADILVYGNGEAPLRQVVEGLLSGKELAGLTEIPGTAVPLKGKAPAPEREHLALPSYEEVRDDRDSFCLMTRQVFSNLNPFTALPLLQRSGSRAVLVNPPSVPLETAELDRIYALPYTRRAHPSYTSPVPALEMIKGSVTSHRGCYGGCSFCSLYLHQGRYVQSRSIPSVIAEVEKIASSGTQVITDVGGATSNMYGTFCRLRDRVRSCRRHSCLYPSVCRELEPSPAPYLELLDRIRSLSCVKRVYINSGVRTDLALLDSSFIRRLARDYTQGRISVAPEHCSGKVLEIMGKPSIGSYEEFCRSFLQQSRLAGRKNQVAPYFIVGHPGSDPGTEEELAGYVRKKGLGAGTVQEFYPSPMTVSTCIYHTSLHPLTGRMVDVQKRPGIRKRWKKGVMRSARRGPARRP